MINNQSDNQDTAERSIDAPAAPFQRPPQMQRSVPGSFAGSYGSSHSSAYDRGSADRRLVIGQGITMSGEIESCDYLLVEGTLEAALKGAKVLEVADTGTFYGTVEIEEATIAGRFEGELTFISRQAEFTPSNVQTPEERVKQVFRIKVSLKEVPDQLRPGMTADIWLDSVGGTS